MLHVLPARAPDTGIRVEFDFPTTPDERQAIDRAVLVDLGGVAAPSAAGAP